jgi:hypothetical protein
MSSAEAVKFKYRIVVNDDTEYPYRISKKGWIFWHAIGKCRSLEEAKDDLRKLVRLEMMKPGTVVLEYNEQDFLADKLKGSKGTL